MQKKWAVFASLLTVGTLLSGCSTGGSKQANNANAKSLNFVVQQEMPTADLSVASDTVSFTALNNVYEGLYRQDKNNELVLAGASEKPEVSEDGLTYKFKLRPDAKWSNGDSVKAQDYVYGWQRTVDPKTASQYAYLFSAIENGKETNAGTKAVSDLGIKAVGDYEIEIKLSQAIPYFERLLTLPIFFPQNQKVVEQYGKDYAINSDNAVYNGPYVLKNFSGPGTDDSWTYAKNEQYWDKSAVNLDSINVSVVKDSSTALNLFKNNQADDIVLTGELAQQNRNDEAYQSILQATTQYLEFNQRDSNSIFKNDNLRKAISYSIDRKALTESILGNGSMPSSGFVPKNIMKSPDGKDFTDAVGNYLNQDTNQAKEYWEKAKQELGIKSLNFSILSSDTDASKKIVEYLQNAIQTNLEGVKVNLTPVPFSVRLDRAAAGNFDLLMGSYGADYLDASSFSDLLKSGVSYNRGQWSNTQYDELINSAATSDVKSPQKRFDDLVNAEKIVMSQQGVSPLYQAVEAHMTNPKVKNYVAHPAGAKFDYKWLTVE
ncbi:peptide ABC transporter substrate-binding protein [Holzapfeliella floricola]|uniref:Oligopeptide ABC superfamily ATP binding cassette transporter, binding protein n=1 Tax=Holzapfeliella floricola DSM 23037 = JCM 16512 TaxID=1423744 RepID=A0A0R2DWI7_9LACO|nr:peptide ABC transporter substrate-binding protein [Holzapfeliella floricola]KRN04653.1 oligopeptide ABC superfamily ATP binding cassette transporter, binding protein [Holzapfeliella floricola DSM 23037 = JCM 16512]